MSKYAHTHPQRYLRKHDRLVGLKRKGNKNIKAAKNTAPETRQDKTRPGKAITKQGKKITRKGKDTTRQDKTRQDKTRQKR